MVTRFDIRSRIVALMTGTCAGGDGFSGTHTAGVILILNSNIIYSIINILVVIALGVCRGNIAHRVLGIAIGVRTISGLRQLPQLVVSVGCGGCAVAGGLDIAVGILDVGLGPTTFGCETLLPHRFIDNNLSRISHYTSRIHHSRWFWRCLGISVRDFLLERGKHFPFLLSG